MDDKSISPILRSMQKDSIKTAQDIVGSESVPAEEALMLAKMQNNSSKKRMINFFLVAAVFIIVIATIIISLPDKFFIKKDTGIVVSEKQINFLKVDASFGIDLPTEFELEKFRESVFSNKFKLSEIVINQNGQRVGFKNLYPLISERFLTNVLPLNIDKYVYGIVVDKNLVATPYLAFDFTDRKTTEIVILDLERTMYTDIANIMKLPNNSEFEILQFESSGSVRSPVRILRANVNSELLVYGYPMDDVVLFARSKEAYEIVKNQMLLGY